MLNERSEEITWRVLRTDDHGNVFTVRRGMSHADAAALHEELTCRGHKQTYEMKPDTVRKRPG